MNLNKFKFYFINFILIFIFSTSVSAKKVPDSFADLAEKLMPSVVNISTTQTIKGTVNPFPFQFPPGSPFEDLFKDFNSQTERQVSSLGSGFIIDAKGIVVTNNHVIQNAEEIIVKVNGKKVNISSCLVSEKDTIELKDKSKKLIVIAGALVNKEREIPDYIQMDEKNKIAKLIRIPKFSEVPYPTIMEPNLVVEYYSR